MKCLRQPEGPEHDILQQRRKHLSYESRCPWSALLSAYFQHAPGLAGPRRRAPRLLLRRSYLFRRENQS